MSLNTHRIYSSLELGTLTSLACLITHLPCLLLGFLLIAGISTENALANEKGWTPNILKPESTLYLPDYSYSGYRNGDVPLKDSHRPTLNVKDFGALPNDGIDDTAAFKKAIAAAAANEGKDVLAIPKGRFIISEILLIRHSHFVLQGSGSGSDGTILAFPKALKDLPLQPESKKTKDKILRDNKKEGDTYYSPFSWSGGFLWTILPKKSKKPLVGNATEGRRGEHSFKAEKEH
ncbi:MAG: hypothetical protein HQL32_14380, partial [Planctomycetes bacterium]|nr:hypothetical protein [Planctomycetota bacterium]